MNSSTLIRCSLGFILLNLVTPSAWAIDQPTNPQRSTMGIVLVLALGIGALLWHRRKPRPALAKIEKEDPFCGQRITQTFIAALPSLSRELNLEIATSLQTEVLERTDSKFLLGINLGSNTAEIRALVTYRYHIRLYDRWLLENQGQSLVVHAPILRVSQPPAIHTDQMQVRSTRGWCRLSPDALVEELRRDLTPTLARYAEDPKRIEFIRESARQSVADFVRLWLEREKEQRFICIHVVFPHEKPISSPTLQLIK